MSSNLDKLIAESEAAIRRLDDIQQRKYNTPIWQRITRHFHKNSPHLINVMMSGAFLFVALGRLAQKHEHQAAKEDWEQQQRRLQAEKQQVEQRAAAFLSSTAALVQGLEEAAEERRRDLPQFVQQQVADWRQQMAAHQRHLAGSPTAGATAVALGDADGDASGSSGGNKIMI